MLLRKRGVARIYDRSHLVSTSVRRCVITPPMYQQLRVAVVIPAFNEEAAVGAAITAVPDFVDHVIVVDDASTDATATVANETALRLAALAQGERALAQGE